MLAGKSVAALGRGQTLTETRGDLISAQSGRELRFQSVGTHHGRQALRYLQQDISAPHRQAITLNRTRNLGDVQGHLRAQSCWSDKRVDLEPGIQRHIPSAA